MNDAEVSATIDRLVPGHPAIVWALASDTNRWDRVLGLAPSSYRYEKVSGVSGPARERVGCAPMFWGEATWIERGDWLEAQWFIGERLFFEGMLEVGGYRFEVAAAEAGSRVEACAYVKARMPVPDGLRDALERNMRQALTRYFDAIDRTISSAGAGGVRPAPGEPAAALARRVLLQGAPDVVASGASTPVIQETFLQRGEIYEGSDVEPELRRKVMALLLQRTDQELRQVRPYEIATAWGTERQATLAAFLYAVSAGLFDLRWELHCPLCRVGAERCESLADLRERGFCRECDLEFSVDRSANVEAALYVNAEVRPIDDVVYCAGSPWFRPHVLAAVRTDAGESREVPFTPPAGDLLLRALPGHLREPVASPLAGSRIRLEVAPERLAATVSPLPDGGTLLDVRNASRIEATILVERASYRPDVVRPGDIEALPAFRAMVRGGA